MLRSAKFFLDDVSIIFSKHRRIRQRGKLLGYLLWFPTKKKFDAWFHFKSETFFGLTAEFSDYTMFYGLWRDIFLYETYCVPEGECRTIIDLGGNIGISVLYFKYLYPDAKVITFEPSQTNRTKLERNIAINHLSLVEVRASAASDHDGTVVMYEKNDENVSDSIWADHAESEKGTPTRAEAITPYLKNIDLLKLDIEGSEYPVLTNSDLSGVKWIVAEVHQRRGMKNDPLHAILTKFDESGFRYVVSSGYMRPMDFAGDPEIAYNLFVYAKRN